MLRDFWLFIVALWGEWKVFLTGGSIIAASSLWNLVGWKPLSQKVDWLILGLTFIAACFSAWRKERVEPKVDFITVRPAELVRLSNTGTRVHANTLVGPYIGKRLKVTGAIDDVEREPGPQSFVYLKADGVLLLLKIASRALEPFIPLPKGTTVTVEARIHSVRGNVVVLTECTMVPTDSFSMQPDVLQSPTVSASAQIPAQSGNSVSGTVPLPSTRGDERIFVSASITPAHLLSFFKDRTSIQAQKLVAPFIGKWMKLSGNLDEVLSSNPSRAQVTFSGRGLGSELACVYMCFRTEDSIDRLSILKRGDSMAVVGRITHADAIQLDLDNCELEA
jgi:hypothetical protein